MLPEPNIEENLSIAYVNAVASVAGYQTYRPDQDWGVDVQIAEVNNINGSVEDTGIYLRGQLKSCMNTRDLGDKIAYDLKNKARNKLVRVLDNNATKKILILLCLDNDRGDWLNQDLNRLVMKKCAYWYYLEGLNPVENNDSTTVLHIPKTNILSVENVRRLMDCIKNGGDLNELQNPTR